MKCDGNSEDHCCYLSRGQVCSFLKEYKDGPRRWSCGLYEKYGTWEAVHTSDEYVAEVAPEWERIVENNKTISTKCGDYPMPGEMCATCGKTG